MNDLNRELERLGLDQIDTSAWPQSLHDLAAVIAEELKRQGLADDDPLPALLVALKICRTYQSGSWYAPKCDQVEISVRNAKIWAQHSGRNTAELARKFGLTQRQIQSIIAAENQRRCYRQNGLFEQTA